MTWTSSQYHWSKVIHNVELLLILTCALMSVIILLLTITNLHLARKNRRLYRSWEQASICLNELYKREDFLQRSHNTLIRRLSKAEMAVDELRTMATEPIVVAKLENLKSDSCWADLHDPV